MGRTGQGRQQSDKSWGRRGEAPESHQRQVCFAFYMAGFQVTINGRIGVTAEAESVPVHTLSSC